MTARTCARSRAAQNGAEPGLPGSHHPQYINVLHREHAVVETGGVRTAKAMGTYLGSLIASDEVITLVSEEAGQLTGFLIATLDPAPPVYHPGGLTCLIDDFVVIPATRWPATGVRLLRAGLTQAGRRGAVQAVVVTAHLDQPKRQALRACGLEVASEWWVTPQALLHGPPQDTDRQ